MFHHFIIGPEKPHGGVVNQDIIFRIEEVLYFYSYVSSVIRAFSLITDITGSTMVRIQIFLTLVEALYKYMRYMTEYSTKERRKRVKAKEEKRNFVSPNGLVMFCLFFKRQ